MEEFDIGIDDPRADDVQMLLETHLAFADEHSPPEDVHALDVAGLLADNVSFFSLRAHGELLAVGALKQLDPMHAEIKSMHTAEAARERGAGRAVLEHLLAVAHARGCRRVSLETGSMDAFAAARALYRSVGFAACEPFDQYVPSRNSAHMTLELDGNGS